MYGKGVAQISRRWAGKIGINVCSQLKGYRRATSASMQRDNSETKNNINMLLQNIVAQSMEKLVLLAAILTSQLARYKDDRSFEQDGGEKNDDVVWTKHL